MFAHSLRPGAATRDTVQGLLVASITLSFSQKGETAAQPPPPSYPCPGETQQERGDMDLPLVPSPVPESNIIQPRHTPPERNKFRKNCGLLQSLDSLCILGRNSESVGEEASTTATIWKSMTGSSTKITEVIQCSKYT